MRPRLFLRTTEFLWQEGHTVHENRSRSGAKKLSACSVSTKGSHAITARSRFLPAKKSESEKFPGAVQTMTIEAMAAGPKGDPGRDIAFSRANFARASGIQFQNREGKQEFGWTTSWGMTTRMVAQWLMVPWRTMMELFCLPESHRPRL